MNKLNLLFSAILVLILVSYLPVQSIAQQNKQNKPRVDGIDLSKKPYFEHYFTKEDRKQLKKANSYLDDGKKYLLEYKMNLKDIDKYNKAASATTIPRNKKKSENKARKLEESNIKTGNKSIDNFKKGTDIKSRIYITVLGKARTGEPTENEKMAGNLETLAKENVDKAREITRNAPGDPTQRLNDLFEANDLTIESLALQENAFALYMNDRSVKPSDFVSISKDPVKLKVVPDNSENNVPNDSILFPVYEDLYNPSSDENLYQLHLDQILNKIKPSKEELNLLADASRKNEYANNLLREVDAAYIIIDSLNFEADRTIDPNKRDDLSTAAIEKEQIAINKLMNATNIQLNVNNTRYQVYKAHLPKGNQLKPVDKTKEADSLIAESEKYYEMAQLEIAKANKMTFISEQYLSKMGANDMLLHSLQLQESAFGLGIFSTQTVQNGFYTYSKDKPKPVPYKIKNGVVFLVHLGNFKEILKPENFGSIQPIVYEVKPGSNANEYMVGEYKTTESSEIALEKVKTLGYGDAYLVSLINGKLKTFAEGKAKINTSDKDHQHIKIREIEKVSGNKTKDPKSNTKVVDSSPNSIKNTTGLVYLVQLGMFEKPKTSEDLKNLEPIYTDKISEKGVRYMMGNYSSFSEAKQAIKRAKDKGFKDAYVIAYNDGENISLDNAKKIESGNKIGNGKTKVISKGKITYMVQLGAYREKLGSSDESKLKNKFSPHKIETKLVDGKNLYLIGNYATYDEANKLKNKLLKEGHEGVFVVVFNGNDKITIEEAKKLSKNK